MEKLVKSSERFLLKMATVAVFMQLAGVPVESRLKLNPLIFIHVEESIFWTAGRCIIRGRMVVFSSLTNKAPVSRNLLAVEFVTTLQLA